MHKKLVLVDKESKQIYVSPIKLHDWL